MRQYHCRLIEVSIVCLVALSAGPGRGGEPSAAARWRPAEAAEAAEDLLPPRLTELPDTRPPQGRMPPEESARVFAQPPQPLPARRGADWVPLRRYWAASNLRHRPLYFEDAMLERHGQSRRPLLQPVVSGTRFFMTFPVLPYAMTVDPPCRPVSTLGAFRPGDAPPLLCQRPPLQVDASLVQAGVLVGLIFLIP